MEDATGQLAITFNGEIYNYQDIRGELESRGHRFRTASDTEVLLEAYRAWNTDCLTRLNGMFAYCLYDSVARQLVLARDRAGEKPLFYYHTPGTLVFASELKALMAYPHFKKELSLEALNHYLTYGYVPGEMCILKGVRKLSQGQAMTFSLETGQLRKWRYWHLPRFDSAADESPDEQAEKLETLLLDSVRRRLIADVPVGILLSGEIDSSLVTAMAARTSPKTVRTFTISFPGHGTFDEGPQARLIANHFGTEHIEMAIEPATVELLPELARQFDEPIADHSMVPTYLVSRLVREHATVALGGDGGDELFGGYPHYSWILQQQRVRRFLPAWVRSSLSVAAARTLPIGFRGRNHLVGFGTDLPNSIAHINMYFDVHTRQRLLSPTSDTGARVDSSPEDYKASLCRDGDTPLQMATTVDFSTYLVDDLLVKVDRASMLASLEVRAPWLDHRIIEYAFGRVPDKQRADERQRKVLPRRLAERLLPKSVNLTRKQGFSLPLASWFKGKWGSYTRDVLREADPRLLDAGAIERLLAAQQQGYGNTQRLFALTMLELWRREYRITTWS